MDLRSFIADSLEQIICGVQDVQRKFPWDNRGAPIIGAMPGYTAQVREQTRQQIEFDVSVVTVYGVGIGGDAKGDWRIEVVGIRAYP